MLSHPILSRALLLSALVLSSVGIVSAEEPPAKYLHPVKIGGDAQDFLYDPVVRPAIKKALKSADFDRLEETVSRPDKAIIQIEEKYIVALGCSHLACPDAHGFIAWDKSRSTAFVGFVWPTGQRFLSPADAKTWPKPVLDTALLWIPDLKNVVKR